MSTKPAGFAPLSSLQQIWPSLKFMWKWKGRRKLWPCQILTMLLILITGIWKLNGLGLVRQFVSGKKWFKQATESQHLFTAGVEHGVHFSFYSVLVSIITIRKQGLHMETSGSFWHSSFGYFIAYSFLSQLCKCLHFKISFK